MRITIRKISLIFALSTVFCIAKYHWASLEKNEDGAVFRIPEEVTEIKQLYEEKVLSEDLLREIRTFQTNVKVRRLKKLIVSTL